MNWSTTYMRSVSVIVAMALAAVTLIAVATTSALAQDEIVLNFLEEKLSLKPDENDQFIGPVTVQNTSAEEVSGLSFKATLYISDTIPFSDGPPLAMVVTKSKYCVGDKCTLPPSEVGQFVLKLPLLSSDKKLSGYVWLNTDGNVRAEVLPLEVTPKPTKIIWLTMLSKFFTPGSTMVPFIALGIAALTAIIAVLLIDWRKKGKSIGAIGWDFSKNWVSSVTAITGLTGAITALFTLDNAQILMKNAKFSEYAFLFALFALMVAVAPVIGKMFSSLFPATKGSDDTRAWVYVLAVAIVVWATTGVLLTAVLFIAEGRLAGNLSEASAIGIAVVALGLGVLTCFYSCKKTIVFARGATNLVEQQDEVTKLLADVRRVRAEGAALSQSDLKAALYAHVNKSTLDAITGFTPKSYSVGSALDKAIERVPPSNSSDLTKAILDALKTGLDAVLAALKLNDDGSFKPKVDLQEAVTSLYKGVESAKEPTKEPTTIGLMTLDVSVPAGVLVMPAPTPTPSGSVRPKVYLP